MIGGADEELRLPLEGEHEEDEKDEHEGKVEVPDIVISGEDPSRVRTLWSSSLSWLL